ncbi:MFS general substrate transporter [Conidiobolus coronatus NRRL 28638]|uniref:MFS general substrate transporter n=1 Tax=Conidiobolus coronatus (strain ATCC 28846 / CBS 209.66 / NRRL 28638) TaxID=796925 RepID=A0A137NZB3_CONC2|nr:MFS general substrate transporter [Conidiobolus coronatus NRRL 28638]|eukprot:KXN68072.1 MFS general substrate transporter [Conidiobolus coronatus NRRL 28638]
MKEEIESVASNNLHEDDPNKELNLGVVNNSQDFESKKASNDFSSKCQEDKSNDKLKSVGGKVLVTLGLVLGTFIGSTSETAVSTITESIGQDLETFGSLTWIAGGYLLTLVAFTPLFGKLSDIFGRKPVELFSILLFAIGSLGCALANSMTLLIIFRAIAGIGGGGSNYLSLISATYVIAQIVGPILGGVLAEVSWRITFYIMLPLCAILAALVIFVMDLPKSEGNILTKVKRVDFLGSITLILAIVSLILATNWGGKDYAWNSVPIIILFVLMIVFFISFVVIELRVSPEPVLPSRVFVRNVVLALTASFMSGGAQFIAIFYIPIYYQNVHGSSPSESSYRLFPFLAIISICCISSSYLIKIFNTIRGVMWAGGAITIIGTCLVAFMRQNSTLAEQIIFVLIYGIGLGLIFQLVIFVCTLSVLPDDVAIVSGLFTFSVNIGGVISLAIAGTIYNNVLVAQISENLPLFNPKDLVDSRIANTLSSENQEILKACYYFAFRYAFICMIPFAILLLISVLGLTKLEIPGKPVPQSEC